MTDETKKLLEDIRGAIFKIESFTMGITRFSQYKKDHKTKSAVERQLGIIGEAVNKIYKNDRGIVLNQLDRIIRLRNRIVHAYDSIDDAIIWAIVKKHLPKLKEEVRALLE
jgi:uncharacterized protein with HEPN domain